VPNGTSSGANSGPEYSVAVGGSPRAMCCAGCAAVAQAIVDAGLSDYYRFRTERPSPRDGVPAALRDLDLYDREEIQRRFVHVADEHRREATLILENIVCAACVWLNERHLRRTPGVLGAHINYTTQRAQVVWDERHTKLSHILAAIAAIGYRAHPYEPSRARELAIKERRRRLRELAVAGVFGMQVMMLAEALYAGAFFGIEPEFVRLFAWLSLAMTLPVLFYAGAGFFRGAWRDLRARRAGMDVPVALGLALAFGASVAATLPGSAFYGGDLYYDAVVMFVFFLLVGRYFEFNARHRAQLAVDALAPDMPTLARRLDPNGEARDVAVTELKLGDRIRVAPGAQIPIDGRVVEGRSSVDESLLTGESTPRPRAVGEAVLAGSTNVESPLTLTVEHVGEATVLAGIQRLLARAQAEKPRIAQRADRAATVLVLAVLVAAAIAGAVWWQLDPARALPIVVAMLVVTCPCALGLATPVALTVAMHRLAARGLLVTRARALERMAEVTDVVFDKTGTLTHGRPQLVETQALSDRAQGESLRIAAGIASSSEHPLSKALVSAAAKPALPATAVASSPGQGIEGEVDGVRYFLGAPDFVCEQAGIERPTQLLAAAQAAGHSLVLMARAGQLEALFVLSDAIRPAARELVLDLKRSGYRIWLLTGDHRRAAERLAKTLRFDALRAELRPQDKVAVVQELQQQGRVVGMVGDGINDAAALAAADVSIAMGDGTRLAHSAADAVLLEGAISRLAGVFPVARRLRRIVRQNIGMSMAYNAVALPLAAFGFVTPWMGAIGMSLSSLVVVANAMRLSRPRANEGK